jgi:eukaryotic-like serine/threonine-protein kinase
MSTPHAVRMLAWAAGTCVLVVALASASFCIAYRAERRTSVVTVPDWTGKPRTAAIDEAKALGLGFSVEGERHDPGVAADRIVSQEPAPGAIVRRGRTVRVTVSLGGETITVPDVVRHPARQAEAEIRRAGLTSGFEARIHDADVPEGQVIDQVPAAGTLAATGERVNRLVSDGPRVPRWVMPDVTGRPLRDVQDWINLCGFRSGPARRVPAVGKAPGTVIGQLPLAGSPIARRDVVELTVAP